MSIYLLAILLLTSPASTSSLYNQGVFNNYSTTQSAADQHKGKRIGGVEFKGVSDPMGAYMYFEEQNIKLLGSSYNSELAETARKALLKWLKENGHANAKVGVSVRPLPTREDEDKEVAVVFTVEK